MSEVPHGGIRLLRRSSSRDEACFGARVWVVGGGVWDVGFRVLRVGFGVLGCRGTSLIRNSGPLGPYGRTMPRALWWP